MNNVYMCVLTVDFNFFVQRPFYSLISAKLSCFVCKERKYLKTRKGPQLKLLVADDLKYKRGCWVFLFNQKQSDKNLCNNNIMAVAIM